uniref:DUF659 domain-containing protein n=1 Tax=Timema monikensis TaxID=170555 RepID=A0A7R9ECK8_9NEOP|nr:unnamed protein product [Timema monikensis]
MGEGGVTWFNSLSLTDVEIRIVYHSGVLWSSENNDEKFMVLLTDRVAYMLKTGSSLKVFYPKLIHVTCLAHAVHRVANHIRAQFPNINAVIQTFDEEDAVSIREAEVATSYSTVVSDLANVKSYFGNLPGVIVSLEARDLPLIESVKIMHTIQEGVKQTPGPVVSLKVLETSLGNNRSLHDKHVTELWDKCSMSPSRVRVRESESERDVGTKRNTRQALATFLRLSLKPELIGFRRPQASRGLRKMDKERTRGR